MLKQCLGNIGEGLLHACITSYIVKSNNLPTIFAVLCKSIMKIKIIVLPWQHRRKCEPAFSAVDQLLILHVKSIFGKYGRGVAAIDILYTLDSASNYSAIQKLKP